VQSPVCKSQKLQEAHSTFTAQYCWQLQKEENLPNKVMKKFLLFLQQDELTVGLPLPSSHRIITKAARVCQPCCNLYIFVS